MRGRWQASALPVLMLVMGMASGCASSGGGEGGCVPRMRAEPSAASVGETVTYSSRDVCEVDVPDGGWRVVLHMNGDDGSSALVRTTEQFDGSWSSEVVVPADGVNGEALISIANWDYSSCPDDASCAGPLADLNITGSRQ